MRAKFTWMLCAGLLGMAGLCLGQELAPGTKTIDRNKQPVGPFVFRSASLQTIIDYYARLTGRSVIQGSTPLQQASINLDNQSDLTVEEAKAALDTVLALHGITLVPQGDKFLKVVQLATVKPEAPPFIGEARKQVTGDSVSTQVIPLKYAEANEVVQALQPYAHPWAQPTALAKSGCILITETAANMNQMLEIVKYIDVPSALRMETRVFTLAHARGPDVVQRLQAIIQETQSLGARAAAPQGNPTPVPTPIVPPTGPRPRPTTTSGGDDSVIEGKVVITADERTNKIFILSRASNFAFFEKMIAELDAKVEPDVIVKVFTLSYATAEDAASLVNSVLTGGTPSYSGRRTSGTSGSRPGTMTTSPIPLPPAAATSGNATDTGFLQFAQGVRILPDPRTNALLVMATREDMERIEKLIQSVDTPVFQVLIEVVIAEVTLNDETDVGIDVFKRLFDAGQVSQLGGTASGGRAPVQLPKSTDMSSVLMSNLPTAAALAGGPAGLTYFATFRNLKLDAIVHALRSTSRGKVLSTPVVQTMDNQEASFTSGESVPVPVSQVSSVVSGSGTLTAGQLNSNIEYKDAAIELKVTPRINPGGYVRMDIEQKVNDFGAPVLFNGVNVPTITKREAKSSVAVQDQSTIVLGGLIKENKQLGEKKVPLLGDIPFLGQLFKSKSTTKVRNELIIFIRPTVIRTDDAAVSEAKRRTQLIKAAEELGLDKQFRKEGDPGTESERQAARFKALEEAGKSQGK